MTSFVMDGFAVSAFSGKPLDQFLEFGFDDGKRQWGRWSGGQEKADVMGRGQLVTVLADRLAHQPFDPVAPGRVPNGLFHRNREPGFFQIRRERLGMQDAQSMVAALLEYLADIFLRTEANTLWESIGSGHTHAARRGFVMRKDASGPSDADA